MKKLLILIGVLSFTFSCSEDTLTDMNTDTKSPLVVPADALLGNAEKNLFDQMTSTNVNTNVFRLFAQHWTETTYLDESRYDILQRNIPDRHWRVIYRDILTDLKKAKEIANEIATVTPKEEKIKQNKIAIIEVLEVYATSILVDTFGDIPYTEALDPEKFPSPKYDKAIDIYKDLFAKLDKAYAKFDSSFASFGASDFIYSGNIAKWKIFANSLKLRMAITVADEPSLNPAIKAKEAFEAGVMTSNEYNATIQYKSTQPNTNPLYEDLVSSGRYDFIAANTLVDKMNDLNDPRRAKYYIPIEGEFIGGPYAQGGDFESYSSPGDPANEDGDHTVLLDPELEGLLLSYTEVSFYLAEAVERGFISGTASTYYNEAVTSSILYWGGNQAEADAYLANPNVTYSRAASWQEKIGEQSWIGYYNRGFEAWTSYRRLDFPKLLAPSNAASAAENKVPVRFTYPVLEQTLNNTNYKAAATAVGGDKLSTKLFWDKF
ncbi:SusD/RagB family nutrient-binding outer membrane lipoprotein [Flavobacterium aestuarii]|uniref:SusD/RagB family nutrient-binding outer membrane lipoprotein n=1 Tax=Flavobacterium aestuarii TaxID=3149227 RepID=UPI0032B4E9A2